MAVLSAVSHWAAIRVQFLKERARLQRFLIARGAGKDVNSLLAMVWMQAARAPTRSHAALSSHLFRTAEHVMRRHLRDVAQHDNMRPAPGASNKPRSGLLHDRERQTDTMRTALGAESFQIFLRFRIDGASLAVIARETGRDIASVEADLLQSYRVLTELRHAGEPGSDGDLR